MPAYSATQQIIIDAYLEATKHHPDQRLPIARIIGIKKHIPKCRQDKAMLQRCEREYIDGDVKSAPVGRKKKQVDNKLISSIFNEYVDYYQAKERYWWLDDILTGVSRLDMGGNTRPLSVGLLYNFISTSTIINTDIVMDYCNVGVRQAQNIILALSITIRSIEGQLIKDGI
jgi:hypothetical protein